MGEGKVRSERTGWRDPDLALWHHKHGFAYSVADYNDLDLNDRHREWGTDCPAVDIDKLFIEYDNRIPIALVDYKFRESLHVAEPNRSSANNRVMSSLYTRRPDGFEGIPFYVTIYTKDPWTFRPIWINTQAKQLAPRNQMLTESGFVRWLYWLRDRVTPSSILNQLDTAASWETLTPANSPKKQRKQKSNLPVPTLFDQNPVMQITIWEAPV